MILSIANKPATFPASSKSSDSNLRDCEEINALDAFSKKLITKVVINFLEPIKDIAYQIKPQACFRNLPLQDLKFI